MELAPAKPTAAPKAKRKVLLFSLETGYKHWVNPHTAIMIKTLAEKSKAFDVVESNDIQVFSPNRIKDFDALIFNNTCSDRKHRNIFLDVLGAEKAEEAVLQKTWRSVWAICQLYLQLQEAPPYLGQPTSWGELPRLFP